MDLPIRFPNDADVIYEDAARFRALTPEAQVRTLDECFQLYRFLRTTSGRAEQIDRLAEEEERLARKAIQEFAAAMDEMQLADAVRRLAVVFERRRIRHALIGGVAVGVQSRPRATKDADFILSVPALSFPALLEDLAADGFEIDVREIIRRWSADRLVVFYRGPVRIDWMQPVVPLYEYVLDTAESKNWLDTKLKVATAEGLILTKMISFRPQDQADIAALLAANRDTVDIDLIRKKWPPYADLEPERTAWLEKTILQNVPPRL